MVSELSLPELHRGADLGLRWLHMIVVAAFYFLLFYFAVQVATCCQHRLAFIRDLSRYVIYLFFPLHWHYRRTSTIAFAHCVCSFVEKQVSESRPFVREMPGDAVTCTSFRCPSRLSSHVGAVAYLLVSHLTNRRTHQFLFSPIWQFQCPSHIWCFSHGGFNSSSCVFSYIECYYAIIYLDNRSLC